MDQDAAGPTGCWGWPAATATAPWTPACGRALELEVISVGKIGSMLERATDRQPLPAPAATATTARFARDPAEFTGHGRQLTLLPSAEGQVR